jgi:aquaporin Z
MCTIELFFYFFFLFFYMKHLKLAIAEAFGTMVLIFVGAGTAVLAGSAVGLLGVAIAFGLAVTAMAYTVGPVSGCHLNPAVSVAMVLRKKMPLMHLPIYVVAQLVGGTIGAALLFVIVTQVPGFDVAQNFASNGFGEALPTGFNMTAAAIAEVLATMIFVTVILGTTRKGYPSAMGGLVIGLTLAILILTIGRVSNASLNPARSFATAVFQGGIYLEQLWLFFVAPTVGAILAAGLDKVLQCDTCECSEKACNVKA